MNRHDVGGSGSGSGSGSGESTAADVDNNARKPTVDNDKIPDDAAARTESYDIPLSYANLNEAEGPAPAENPDELPVARHRSLEDYREEDQRRSAQFTRTKVNDRRRYGTAVSRPRVELYTVAYLVFFALLGTLARLGLSSLTTYTGAPVTFGVLWANFSGTAVLGFLAELAPLINRDHAADELEEQLQQDVAEPEKQHESEVEPNNMELNRDMADADPVDEVEDDQAVDQAVDHAGNNAPAGAAPAPAPPSEQSLAPSPAKRPKPIPLYIGLATGFCGSFTSFSTFMLEVFEALANIMPAPKYHPGDASSTEEVAGRGVGFDFMAPLAVLFLTVGMCLSALKLGAHIAIFLNQMVLRRAEKRWKRTHSTAILRIFDNAVVILGFGAWLAAILITIFQPDPAKSDHWRTDVLFALVFAPVGCLLRFYLSLKLNGIFATFPLGTFTVNILGTAILAMAWDLQHASAVAATRLVGCQVLQGIMDGFCGCLTTVSTWMAELTGLKRRHSYFYGGVSMATGLVLLVLVVGTPKWTMGWQEPVC